MRKIIYAIILVFMLQANGFAGNSIDIQALREEYVIDDEGRLLNFEITATNKSNKGQIFLHLGHVSMNWLEVIYQDVSYRMIPYVDARYEAFQINPPEMQNQLVVDRPDYMPHYEGYLLNPDERITFSFGPMLFGKRDKYWEVATSDEIIVLNAVYHYTYMPKEEFPDGKERKVSSKHFQIKCAKKWFRQVSKTSL